MRKQKLLGISLLGVLAVLAFGGLVTAYMAENSTGKKDGLMKPGRGAGGFAGLDLEDLDLPENATREQVRAAVRTRNIEQLGLSEDATDEEIRAAMQQQREQRQAKLNAAIQAGDYETWKALVLETPQGEGLAEVITEENFQKYAEMQQHRNKAKELAEELGIPENGRGMRGGSARMRGGCPDSQESE